MKGGGGFAKCPYYFIRLNLLMAQKKVEGGGQKFCLHGLWTTPYGGKGCLPFIEFLQLF